MLTPNITVCFFRCTGGRDLTDDTLEPAVLHDLLHRHHGEGALPSFMPPGGCAWLIDPFRAGPVAGRHDHHRGLHPRRLRVPDELQPEEQGTAGRPGRFRRQILCTLV